MKISVPKSKLTLGQRQFLESQEPVILMSGGFGSGKTTALALKLLQLKASNPNVPGLLISQSYKSLWAISFRRLMSILRLSLPADKMPQVVDRQGECYLDFGDGVPVFLRSAVNPDSIDGLDVGWLLGDELRHWPQHTYEVALGRVRAKCDKPQIAFASTPEMHWMAEEFNTSKRGRQLIIAPTSQNERNLAPGFIDNLRLSYSPRLQKAVIDGYFTTLEGAVYESLDPDFYNSDHAIEYNPKRYLDRKTYLAVDPGFRRSAYLWIHEVAPMEWVVFDEIMPEHMSDAQCVEMVNNRGWPIDEIWCDPAADNTQSAIGIDTVTMLRGIRTRSRTPIRYITGIFRAIPFGVDKTRTLLGDQNLKSPIRIKFAKRLEDMEKSKARGIVRDLLGYRYPEMKHGQPVGNLPFKDGLTDHSVDALRYWAVGMWLTSGLRELDPIMKTTNTGYKVAA